MGGFKIKQVKGKQNNEEHNHKRGVWGWGGGVEAKRSLSCAPFSGMLSSL